MKMDRALNGRTARCEVYLILHQENEKKSFSSERVLQTELKMMTYSHFRKIHVINQGDKKIRVSSRLEFNFPTFKFFL